jgi:hypothetical protein
VHETHLRNEYIPPFGNIVVHTHRRYEDCIIR